MANASATAMETLRALAAPRRLVPVLVVVTPLLIEQAQTRDARALALGAALCAACVTLGPVTWRIVAAPRATVLRVAIYAAIGAAVVLALGAGVPTILRVPASFLTATYNLGISVALYWVGGWGLGRDIDMEARLEKQRARAEALAREAERAQMLAVKAHLDPHFLFNTLNAIAEWCRVDGAVAERAVLGLADMLRAVLAGARAEWWPLEKELALVDALFALHQMRDPERFTVVREIEPAAMRVAVPPLFLLPIAENAVKHGPSAGHAGEIFVSVARRGAGLAIAIENPGAFHGRRPGGEGLATAEKRLELAYDGRARMTIAPRGARTRVDVEVP